ncbi:MAG: ATP-dependent DNA helicase, partial [Verrucomicrobiota bacterium]
MISINDNAAGQSLVDEVREFFSPEGALSSLKHFEYRAEQQQMAVSVAASLVNAEPLVVEAGTGVGKSLAYLVPAVLLAKREKRKAVITTHTI